jgi:hypothetical protein
MDEFRLVTALKGGGAALSLRRGCGGAVGSFEGSTTVLDCTEDVTSHAVAMFAGPLPAQGDHLTVVVDLPFVLAVAWTSRRRHEAHRLLSRRDLVVICLLNKIIFFYF